MRYLNRIIFINSASVKYTELNLDGNVHFIGTQGVGKSTLLRAILFFYNADKLKLGISREKKGFDEYYFPFANSYIIYEVVKETGTYCVLAYKQQGRVCFRFFDAAFDKSHFIDKEGIAFSSWDYIRNAFDKKIRYSRKIEYYEEYRDILYGNNSGLPSDFKKYALLESKNYRNVPRTIQNVFLNSKLDAEFIKQTIIMSLSEEDVNIDLSSYSSHLKDFETMLNDIGKWTEKNAKGEFVVRNQANKVTELLSSIHFLEHEIASLAGYFNFALEYSVNKLPKELEKSGKEKEKKQKSENKLQEIDARYQSKKDRLNGDISIFSDKLEEIKRKEKYYKEVNITEIIQRVSKKTEKEREKRNLHDEKNLLTSRFEEIKMKYEAILKQIENQKNEFINSKKTEKNRITEDFLKFKEIISAQYETYFNDIRKQHQSELELLENSLKEKSGNIQELRLKEVETTHKSFYLAEIDNCKQDISSLKEKIYLAENTRKQAGEQIITLQKQWELENTRSNIETASKKEKVEQRLSELNKKIATIDTKLENLKDSLYEWLNKEHPGWESTIGKVIDEENVLFAAGLNPRKIAEVSSSDTNTVNTTNAPSKMANTKTGESYGLYGISIDLTEIAKEVKTIPDYEAEKEGFIKQVASLKKQLDEFDNELTSELEKIKQKYNPKIRALKDVITTNRIQAEQSVQKLDETEVSLTDWQRKAENEKASIIEQINMDINRLTEDKLNLEDKYTQTKAEIEKKIERKAKEKNKKIQEEKEITDNYHKDIEDDIRIKESETVSKLSDTKAKQEKELAGKGADTKRLAAIDAALSLIDSELEYIEDNRDKVSDYHKDKRELFDKTDDFRNKKQSLEKQLHTELEKYKLQKEKSMAEISLIDEAISSLEKEIQRLQSGLNKTEQFRLTDAGLSIGQFTAKEKTDKYCSELIDSINANYYKTINRYNDLKESINRFLSNFKEDNIFNFNTHMIEKEDFIRFAEELKEFIEEDKISTFQIRVSKFYTDTIRQIGKETTDLVSRSGAIQQIIKDINSDFVGRIFTGVIKSIELRIVDSGNKVVQWMLEIKKFNDEHSFEIGEVNLFSTASHESINKKSVELLKSLVREIGVYKEDKITLSDSFELQFKIVENDNDSGWVEKLSNVGSDGTDVLVKAMINIMLLNVFKEHASKRFNDFKLHCMMDEIGKLHPTNIKGILAFANSRNILLINSSPTSYNATDYKYTYLLRKDAQNVTMATPLIKKINASR